MTDASDDDANQTATGRAKKAERSAASGDGAQAHGLAETNSVGLIGKTLGRYRITAELGRGGMATVYRASDPQLGREVAIKVMHGTFTGRGDIERRFRREAQAVAAIKHDSIVDIFDFAPGSRGEPGYIVTEIIEGPTLRELMTMCGGRIVPEVAALLGARVAGALGAAHRHGIVHRDVKPDNVMLDSRPAGEVRVVLTDFGVAHIVEDDAMTVTGSLLGSPAYMSPEQARGQPVGPQSDVFSLGALLYHLVTGRTPFQGKDPMTVIAALLYGALSRPSQLDAHVSAPLEAIILRCLNRAPADRYADAGAVHVALRGLADEAGLTDDAAALRAFLDDRAAFVASLSRRIAEQALQNARRNARRGELTRALAEVNRVFAYQPEHAGAEALLASITSRRRWTKRALVAAAAVALAGAALGVSRLADRRETTAGAPLARPSTAPAVSPERPSPAAPAAPSSEAPAPSAARTTREFPSPTAPSVSSGAAVAPPTESSTRAKDMPVARPAGTRAVSSPARAAKGAPPAKGSATRRQDSPRPPADEPPPAPEAATSPAATTAAAPPPVPAAAAPAAPSQPPTAVAAASLIIRASQGFCSPSMDDHPAKIRPVYEGVTPGNHRIYCTLPGGPKVPVGTYDLHPGTRPNLVIVPGPDGKPTLSRPK